MTRERKAQIATIMTLTSALAVAAAKRSGWLPVAITPTAQAATPQETIYQMMDAARDGDVRE